MSLQQLNPHLELCVCKTVKNVLHSRRLSLIWVCYLWLRDCKKNSLEDFGEDFFCNLENPISILTVKLFFLLCLCSDLLQGKRSLVQPFIHCVLSSGVLIAERPFQSSLSVEWGFYGKKKSCWKKLSTGAFVVLHHNVVWLSQAELLSASTVPVLRKYHNCFKRPSASPSLFHHHGHEMECSTITCISAQCFAIKGMWMRCKIHLLCMNGSWNIGKILNFSSTLISCLPPALQHVFEGIMQWGRDSFAGTGF